MSNFLSLDILFVSLSKIPRLRKDGTLSQREYKTYVQGEIVRITPKGVCVEWNFLSRLVVGVLCMMALAGIAALMFTFLLKGVIYVALKIDEAGSVPFERVNVQVGRYQFRGTVISRENRQMLVRCDETKNECWYPDNRWLGTGKTDKRFTEQSAR